MRSVYYTLSNMKFRLMSDLHLEFGGMDVPPLPEDASTTLVLAGDIGLADRTHTYSKFIKRMANQFKDVIWINGNHEFYHSSFIRGPEKIRAHLDDLLVPNVHYGDRFTVIIDGVAFICATLWTDMDEGNPSSAYFISGPQGLNDFRLIRSGSKMEPYKRRLSINDCVFDFKQSKRFIFEEIEKHMADGLKTVVVTHHGCSHLSIADQFKGDRFNGAYVTELGNDIVDVGGPNVWVHGHTHVSFDYMIGDTRIVVNPRGYVGHELNEDFDPKMEIDV